MWHEPPSSMPRTNACDNKYIRARPIPASQAGKGRIQFLDWIRVRIPPTVQTINNNAQPKMECKARPLIKAPLPRPSKGYRLRI